ILGTFLLRDSLIASRLVRTNADKVTAVPNSPIMTQIAMAANEPDAKTRVEKFKSLLQANRGTALTNAVYGFRTTSAAEAGWTPQEVTAHPDQWLAEAKPYGQAWINEQKLSALRALSGKKPYQDLELNLSMATEKELGDAASTAVRSEVAHF